MAARFFSWGKEPLVRGSVFVQLIDCITQHVEHAFSVSIPLKSHEHWFAPKQLFRIPVATGLQHSILWTANADPSAYVQTSLQRKPRDNAFDEQDGELTSRIFEGMEEFSRLAAGDFPGLNIATPRFMSDDNCLGLQAADILACLLRRGEALSMHYSVKIWTDGFGKRPENATRVNSGRDLTLVSPIGRNTGDVHRLS